MNREDAIWLAGLLEGEGSFCVFTSRPGARPTLRAYLKMTDKDVVERAANLMDTEVYRLKPKPSRKPTYETRAYGKKAEEVMRQVLPFMGARRSAKIIECLATPNLSYQPKPSGKANL